MSAGPLPGNNLGQDAHMHVPLSPSSIIWYQPIGGDALWLEGNRRPRWKVMAAYRRVDGFKSHAG